MGVTMTKWEGPIFTGDKEFNGSLAIDAEPGGEKVTNGSFTGNATGWTLGAQWAYGSNAVAKSGAGTSTLSQDVSAIADEIYKVVYTTSGISGGSITVSIGGVSGTARTTNATFTEYITATGTGALTFTPASATAVTIDDVSVKRVGVAAADRVTAWVGDRIASGVEQAGDAGLFVRSEDGTMSFLGDRLGIGTAEPYNGTSLEVLGAANATEAGGGHYTFGNLAVMTNDSAAVDKGGILLLGGSYTGTSRLGFGYVKGALETLDAATGYLAFGTALSGTGSAERMRITSVGQLLINATAAYGRLGQLLEVNTSANYGGMGLSTWSTTAAEGALLDINRSKSATKGTHAIVSNNDVIGMLNWRASDGASFMDGARIVAEIDGTPGLNDMPTRLVFMTTPDGSASLIERLRIDSAGYMGLGTVASAATLFEAAEVKTITGAVTDGYSGALTLDPGYTAATALTVTRHNYIDVQNVSNAGAGPSAVTDACVLRFDAAAGTHKATVGATTKTTPGGVDGWMKVNVNGTIYYMPMYTSTTA